MQIKCADVKVGKRYRSKVGDLTSLCISIQSFGLLQPIGVTKQHELIFGQRRLEAHRKLGLKKIEARVFDLDDLGVLHLESEENGERVDISKDDKLALAAAIKAKLKERRGNPNLGQNDQNGQKPPCSSNSATSGGIGEEATVEPAHGEESRDVIAKAAGFSSHHEYERSKAVKEQAPAEIWQAVQEGVVKLGDAFNCLGQNNLLLLTALDRVKAGTAKTLKAGLQEPKQSAKSKAAIQAALKYEAPSEDSEPERDCNGRVMPAVLSQVKKDGEAFAEFTRHLASMITLMKECRLDGHRSAHLPLSALNDAENLKNALLSNTFHCVCVYCDGKRDDCRACHGGGWINKDAFERAPREKKKAS